MYKIIIFSFSPIYDDNQWQLLSFYEGFSEAFSKKGHVVRHIITNECNIDPWNGNNIPFSKKLATDIINKIKKFSPDLIISFNNSIINNIHKYVDCPIVIAEADRWIYFSNKLEIKKNVNRYHFFYFTKFGGKDFIENFGANKKQIFNIPLATSFTSESLIIKNNINFIGSLYDINYAQNKKEFNNAKYRLNILDKLKEFNPIIYTNYVPPSYKSLEDYISTKQVYKKNDVQKIFNQSSISLNISNLQAKNIGFSWRLLDIMSSNSLLITETNNFLTNNLYKISSKQLYESPRDCFNKIKYFLKNKSAMPDLIFRQNEYTNKNARWDDRVKKIEEIFNLKINNNSNTNKLSYHSDIIIIRINKKIKFDNYILFFVYLIRFAQLIFYFIKTLFISIKTLFISIKTLFTIRLRKKIKKNTVITIFIKKIYLALQNK
jgi:ABC-type Na+ transport system ATPase subunit NatA